MSLSSINKGSPRDFPLRVFVRNGNNAQLQLVAKLPNSIWVPRIGERLIIPILDEFSKTVGSRTLKVQDVTYDLVDDGVYITCENVSVSLSKKPSTSRYALSAMDRLEAIEVESDRKLKELTEKTQAAKEESLLRMEEELDQLEFCDLNDELATLKTSLTSENRPSSSPKNLDTEDMEKLKRELDQL